MTTPALSNYDLATAIHNDVLARANREDEETSIPYAFADLVLEAMAEAGVVDEGGPCFFERDGMQVHGYSINDVESRIELFTVLYVEPVGDNIDPGDIRRGFRGLRQFFVGATNGLHESMEESSEAFDMAEAISGMSGKCSSLRLHVLANGPSHISRLNQEPQDDVEVIENVWDIRRIHRLREAGQDHEEVEIVFGDEMGAPLKAIAHHPKDESYVAYLTIIPGEVLANIYARYSSQILESNVRSFLSVRTKVNSGIRDTLIEGPSSFLAYNNGITMTATRVISTPDGSGAETITEIHGLQVVNGGQTTVSLHNTSRRYGVDLTDTGVMAKILELPAVEGELDPKNGEISVALVSRYANTQNIVSQSDFSANNPFHVAVERLSRRMWAPAKLGANHETHWFYERSRGQYDVARNAGTTRGKIKDFDRLNPKSARNGNLSQLIKKEDLAKVVMAWDQYPHIVALGAQKNFAHFMIAMDELKNFEPDELYFQDSIAKAIIFRRTDKIVAKAREGYKAQIVAHTVSALSHITARRLDLSQIWRSQDLQPELQDFIESLSFKVRGVIANPSNGRNVTEWAKADNSWEAVKQRGLLDFPSSLESLLGSSDSTVARSNRRGNSSPTLSAGGQTPQAAEDIAKCDELGSQFFWDLAVWGRETKALDNYERRLCGSIARRIQGGSSPTYKQAAIGVRVSREAERQGFKFNPS
jgi:hypothetical protein